MIISVDIEADGPCPGLYSMISLGAVDTTNLSNTWYGEFRPISENYNIDALNSFNMTRKQTMDFPLPFHQMKSFQDWLNQFDRPRFMSDNAGFDWQFVNYYFHFLLGKNPFGFSPFSLTSWAQGAGFKDWKRKYRKTAHTHNALMDAQGNAEAYNTMMRMLHAR